MFVDFAGVDWHLRPDAPLNVCVGGLNLSLDPLFLFTTDMDDVLSTIGTPGGMTNIGATGWSMGAYEWQ